MLKLELDHVGVAIRSLDRGRDAYARLGFKLAPRSFHSGSRAPGGPVEVWGSGNHCAMFREGYLEIIGLTDTEKYSSVKDMVDRYEGLHIVAIGVNPPSGGGLAIDAAREQLLKRGVPVEGARSLERDAAFGPNDEEIRRAKFRNCYVDRQKFTEARFLYIEHLTRDVIWQPQLLDHPNGATAIEEVYFASDDPKSTAHKLAALLPSPARGRFYVMTGAEWKFRPMPPLPSAVGFGIRVASLVQTRACLAASGVKTSEDRGIWVDPADACGATIRFFEKE
jgi:catechol 2,3-dioxygenase-like lactoylglutathione lyase family enzyme